MDDLSSTLAVPGQHGIRCDNDPRLAGGVVRYHIQPMLERDTVASHSWQVVRILLAIFPAANRELIVQAIFHDVGEGGSCDVPWGVKQRSPMLAAEIDRLENESWLAMVLPWNLPPAVNLSVLEKKALKLADVIEMHEKGLQEILMGNQLARLIVTKTRQFIDRVTTDPQDQEERDLFARVSRYITVREVVWGIVT